MKVNYDMTIRNFQDMLTGKDGVMGVSAAVEEMKLVNLNQRITDEEKLKLLSLMVKTTSEFEKGWQTVINIQPSDTIATSSNIDLKNSNPELDKMRAGFSDTSNIGGYIKTYNTLKNIHTDANMSDADKLSNTQLLFKSFSEFNDKTATQNEDYNYDNEHCYDGDDWEL